jgi:toxin HigB-1
MTIRSYRNQGSKDIAAGRRSKAARRVLPLELHRNALVKIGALDLASSLSDLGAATGLGLEKLHGDRSGQHSIRINKRYQICFCWTDNNAEEVEIVDYH